MSSKGVLQCLPTLGGAEVGRGAEGGGAPCAELEPGAGLMGPRGPGPLRTELLAPLVPLLSATGRALPTVPTQSRGKARRRGECVLCSRGSTAGPGPGIWDLGQWKGPSLAGRVSWEVFRWPTWILEEEAVCAGPSLGRPIVVPARDEGGEGMPACFTRGHVLSPSR